ncbi:precursor of CEP3-like [Raphanus sativus]|uniref:Precursor of CEP3-like n=1 Tax=Raphanus sativus TaxID=3726 RepID=A0A6J0JTE1_RAPSA|nr:precursor of CEP3-like [Raphanus sativus]
MARINVYLFAFMLLLTINQEFGSVEGRTLTKSTMRTVEEIGEDGSMTLSPPAEPFQPPPSHGVDTFRPTVPGHSPGIGHSVHN